MGPTSLSVVLRCPENSPNQTVIYLTAVRFLVNMKNKKKIDKKKMFIRKRFLSHTRTHTQAPTDYSLMESIKRSESKVAKRFANSVKTNFIIKQNKQISYLYI